MAARSAEEHADHIDLEQLAKKRLVGLLERDRPLRDAGVVEHDVEAAELAPRPLPGCLDLLGASYVNPLVEGYPARLPDLGGHFGHAGLVDVDHHDLGPFQGKPQRAGVAKPGGPAGDHRRLATQSHGCSWSRVAACRRRLVARSWPDQTRTGFTTETQRHKAPSEISVSLR